MKNLFLAAASLLVFSVCAEAGFLKKEHTLSFNDASLWRSVFYEGEGKAEFREEKAVVTLNCKAAAFFPVQQLRPELYRPVSAVFHVKLLQGAAELRFLLSDSNGKEFRADWKKLIPGENTLSFSFDGPLSGAAKPVRVTGLSLRSADGFAVIELEKMILVSEEPQVNSLQFSVESGYPLNIENPESGEGVKLKLFHSGPGAIRTAMTLELRDSWREEPLIRREEHTIPAGKAVVIALPAAEKRGIRYGTLELASLDAPGIVRRESFSVAVMTPATPSPLTKAQGFLFGVCGHPWRYSAEEQKREAAAAALCGAKILREDANWGKIQPRAGEWDFSHLDRIVDIFGAQGVELELIYSYTPRWAVAKDFVPLKEERNRIFNSRPDYDAWREFVRRTAARYRGRIRFFEVWNEPDLFSFSNFSAEEYLEMLKIAAVETRKVNPEARVLTGGYTCMPPYFALNDQKHQEKILSQGKGFYDIHAFHGHGPFSHYFPQIERMLTMRSELEASAPWWANETAESSVHAGEAGQAVTLWKKLFYSWANGSIGYNWYDLRNDGNDPRNVEHNFGMIRHDFNPKAIYPVYNTITRNFAGAEHFATFSAFPALRLYGFRDENGLLLAGWNDSPDSDKRLLFVRTDAGSAESFDLFDNREAIPLSGGWGLFPVGSEPAGIRLTDAKTFEPVCEPVTLSHAVVLPRGENVLKLNLTNPFPTAESFELSLKLPEGVNGKAPLPPLRLKAGEKREIAVALFCDRNLPAESKIAVGLRLPGRRLAGSAVFPVQPVARIGKEYGVRPDFILNQAKQLTTLVPADPGKVHLFWTGPEDLSAELYLAADNETLKLKAVVTDDIHYQPFRGEQVWEGDNIQFGLLIPGQRKPWQIGLTRLADGTGETWVWSAPEGFDPKKSAAAIQLATSRNPELKQTVYEMKLPLEAVGAKGVMGMIRFNLIVNDNDGEMRESFLGVTPGLGTGINPAVWYLLEQTF